MASSQFSKIAAALKFLSVMIICGFGYFKLAKRKRNSQDDFRSLYIATGICSDLIKIECMAYRYLMLIKSMIIIDADTPVKRIAEKIP